MSLARLYREIEAFYPETELVFGDGDAKASLLLIGEAPGREEVERKKPFAGRAGKNLDEFLAALALAREEIYITNVCKFRPFRVSAKGTVSNRPPTKQEILAAKAFLHREIAEIGPRLIVTLGNTPLRAVKDDHAANIGDYHGRLVKAAVGGREYPLFALYHPASIIYNPSLKEVYRGDLAALAKCLPKGV